VRFQVLMAESMNIRAFWYIQTCSLITLMMEAVRTSEKLLYSNKNTRRHTVSQKAVIFLWIWRPGQTALLTPPFDNDVYSLPPFIKEKLG
jgi:hypothetical protein